jgi:magnesium chelatase subunit I
VTLTTPSETSTDTFHILPYTQIVGQPDLKLALELAYVAPRIGGVLLSGQRGTAKSTAVRAFSRMVYGDLPTTLPINVTEDRVVGGWKVEDLMKGEARWQPGLLEEASGKILYVDEVNLLEDHIVNVILDVASTGVLTIEREGRPEKKAIAFALVGTMNPEEGTLRPQLLDRFGLKVTVRSERSEDARRAILKAVLDFDGDAGALVQQGRAGDAERKATLDKARELFKTSRLPDAVLDRCVALADFFDVEGHRGERVTALAAGALAAIDAAGRGEQAAEATDADVNRVAPFALQHRRPVEWDEGKDGAELKQTTAELRDEAAKRREKK